jgi:hypothetical protein
VVLCRPLGPATSFCSGFIGLFMGSQLSGFGDIHQGIDDRTVKPIGPDAWMAFLYRLFKGLYRPFSPTKNGCEKPPAPPHTAYIGLESCG